MGSIDDLDEYSNGHNSLRDSIRSLDRRMSSLKDENSFTSLHAIVEKEQSKEEN